MTIVETYDVDNTKESAQLFATMLATEKGVQSEIVETLWGHIVEAEDGKAVSFHRKWRF